MYPTAQHGRLHPLASHYAVIGEALRTTDSYSHGNCCSTLCICTHPVNGAIPQAILDSLQEVLGRSLSWLWAGTNHESNYQRDDRDCSC